MRLIMGQQIREHYSWSIDNAKSNLFAFHNSLCRLHQGKRDSLAFTSVLFLFSPEYLATRTIKEEYLVFSRNQHCMIRVSHGAKWEQRNKCSSSNNIVKSSSKVFASGHFRGFCTVSEVDIVTVFFACDYAERLFLFFDPTWMHSRYFFTILWPLGQNKANTKQLKKKHTQINSTDSIF